jgi:hypothetical protein
MNYAKAAKGPKTKDYMLKSLNSKAEVELGHKLSDDEALLLSNKFSFNHVYDCTEKVNFFKFRSSYIDFIYVFV